MNDGRRGFYRVYRGVFEARGIEVTSWVKSQEDHAKNLDAQTAKASKKENDRKCELQHLENERQHQRLVDAQDGYFERFQRLTKIREIERKRQHDRHTEAAADRVPQLPASDDDQLGSDGLSNADVDTNAGDGAEDQLADALNQMELGPWPGPAALEVVDQAIEAARTEDMVVMGARRGQLQSFVSAPTFATYQEAHQAIAQSSTSYYQVVCFEYPPDDPDPNIPESREGYMIMPPERNDQAAGLPLSSLPGPVRTPAGAPTAMMSDPVDVDADPEVTREVVDV